jgi:GNAT superfamily N-acetyltransferase
VGARNPYEPAIRPAAPRDLVGLRALEVRAGQRFRAVGMDLVAADVPPPVEHLAAYQRDGRMWVATDAADRPVAYCLVDVLDGAAHLEQLSVDPGHARQGIGRRLIDVAAEWARDAGSPELTLRTFRDVPWNAPYYRRLGFVVIPEDELSPALRALAATEARLGLTQWPRVAMRRGRPDHRMPPV